MEENERALDKMLEADGGFTRCYRKLLLMATALRGAALAAGSGNPRLTEMEPLDLVHTAFERLLEENPGDLRPYYALRNFVRNKIRTLAKSPVADREVPIGGDGEEWAEFWNNAFEPTENNPNAEAELREAADRARKAVFRLRGELRDDEDAQEIFAAWDLGLRKRHEIINESKLSAKTYDAAWKRLQRRAWRLWKGLEHE